MKTTHATVELTLDELKLIRTSVLEYLVRIEEKEIFSKRTEALDELYDKICEAHRTLRNQQIEEIKE